VSGESQVILSMFGGFVVLVVFLFRHLMTRINEITDVLVKHAGILAAMSEVNKKMEQWYKNNIPELHNKVAKVNDRIADTRVSIARLKGMSEVDAKKILEEDDG
jgi:predicted  nucleic acid-binding Zn-ribbon protein